MNFIPNNHGENIIIFWIMFCCKKLSCDSYVARRNLNTE